MQTETQSPLATPPTPDDFWSLMVQFALSLRGWWADLCAGLDLTPSQGMALHLLDPAAPVAMSGLADSLKCDASNVTGVVDKLEARGLIVRQSAENDRRMKMLVVTEKGREMQARVLALLGRVPPSVAAIPIEIRASMASALRDLLGEASPGPAAPGRG